MPAPMKFGAVFSPKDFRDYHVAASAIAKEFPETFQIDLAKVRKQQCSSCVANSLAGVVEYYNNLQKGSYVKMSASYIYGNRRQSSYHGQGMVVRDALKNLTTYGDVPHAKFPYDVEVPEAIERFEDAIVELESIGTPNRISSYFRLRTVDEVKTALMKYGPVVMAMRWYDDISFDEEHVMHTAQKTADSSHCMLIYGWNSKGWLVRNSWGATWQDKGNCIIPFDIGITELWGVSDNIIEDDLVKPYKGSFLEIIAKIFNFIVNLFIKHK